MTDLLPDRRAAVDVVELTRRQLQAVDAWHRVRREAEEAAQVATASRERRMDLTRRVEVLRAQHEAIVARVEQHLHDGLRVTEPLRPRAVVAHRNEWFVSKLVDELERQGVRVVGTSANGAEAVGVVVAEQPDLVVVEDALPMLPGEQVVREVRRFAPAAVVVAHVDSVSRVPALVEAGAATAFTRRVPPAELAQGSVELLAAPPAV